jgi:LPXTG-motif cell wall-anchored protein
MATVTMAQPTTTSAQTERGTPTEKTQTLSGTVVQVEGNTLVVKMSSGDIRMFTPPPDRRFIVDGKELTLSELQPGTKLKATVKETTTPVVDRTVQTLEGTVWYTAAPTVILTLQNGENRMYRVESGSPVKFYDSDGKEQTVFDLRKGMRIKATKITEAPRTELVTAVAVTGTRPAAAAATTGTSAETSRPAAAAPPPPAGTSTGGTPKALPKTASPLPLLGVAGLVSLIAGMGLTLRRRRLSR